MSQHRFCRFLCSLAMYLGRSFYTWIYKCYIKEARTFHTRLHSHKSLIWKFEKTSLMRQSKTYLFVYIHTRTFLSKVAFVGNYTCMILREASHIDFVHEKRHMDVGGGGGVAPVTFLGEKLGKISIVCWKFIIFWNYLYKVYKIQHFRMYICILSIFVCSLSDPGLSKSVLLNFYALQSVLKPAR